MEIDEENTEESRTRFIRGLNQDLHKKYEDALAKNAELVKLTSELCAENERLHEKKTIVTASQVGDGLVCMEYCYFHQTAALNMCFSNFCCCFLKKPELPSFSVWNFNIESNFISISKKKKDYYCCFCYEPFNYNDLRRVKNTQKIKNQGGIVVWTRDLSLCSRMLVD